jgi:hypothetical protein
MSPLAHAFALFTRHTMSHEVGNWGVIEQAIRKSDECNRMTQLYQIRVQGHLDASWATWFDGLAISHESDGSSMLSGQIADQAALHSVLGKIRDLGLTLIAIQRLDPRAENDSSG